MSLFTLFPTLRSQPISRTLRDSRAFWATLDEFDQILGDLSEGHYRPQETDSAYAFTLALPGFKRDQVVVEVHNEGYLAISATRGSRIDSDGETVKRSISIPTDADPTKVEAKLEDGLLTIVIQKQSKPTPPAPRKVTVT